LGNRRSHLTELRQQLATRTTAQRTMDRAKELLSNFWTLYDTASYEDRRELIAAVVQALGGAKATKEGITWDQQPRLGRSPARVS
jgi:hypothetical protein